MRLMVSTLYVGNLSDALASTKKTAVAVKNSSYEERGSNKKGQCHKKHPKRVYLWMMNKEPTAYL